MKYKKVICIGEVLWDSFTDGMFLGGAPLNVAVNLAHLGIDVSLISAVGNDRLGKDAIKEMKSKKLTTTHIQISEQPTGLVDVKLDELGTPQYVIHKHRAWDNITLTDAATLELKSADILVFGSLSFRGNVSEATIKSMLKAFKGLKILDVNFRKPHYNKPLIEELLGFADFLKVNGDELQEITQWFGLDEEYHSSIPKICTMYGVKHAIITLGEQGAILYSKGQFYDHPRYKVEVKDTVGAGDAFLAGVIYSLMNQKSPKELLAFANAMGAYVSANDGATPIISLQKIIEKFDLE